jgi:hypothetical protein
MVNGTYLAGKLGCRGLVDRGGRWWRAEPTRFMYEFRCVTLFHTFALPPAKAEHVSFE